uniref:Uncharacterized protein n=1 Tax=Oryza nivara TaxID=4536 RepID=A0A0E0G4X1_ORYNI
MQKVVPFLRRSILAPFPFPSLSSFFFFTGVFALSCGAEEASQHSLRAKKRRIQRRQADPGFFMLQNARQKACQVTSHSVYPSLTDLAISSCEKLSSLDHFLQADYMPVLERISIRECANVTSLQTERFGEFSCLGDFTVSNCPKLFHNSGSLSVPTLKNLELRNSGILLSNIECSSLTSLSFKCVHVTAIPIQPLNGNLPSLQEFNINECESLTFFAESYPLNGAFSFLTVLVIRSCHKLPTLDGLLKKEYLPAIERIEIGACTGLLSLPGESLCSKPHWMETLLTQVLIGTCVPTPKFSRCGSC